MIRNPSSSDVISAQQMVQDTTYEEGKDEHKEQEHFFLAADNTGNDTNKVIHSVEPDEATTTIVPESISGTASNKKLKRSTTSIPTSKESVTARPTSVDDKLIAVPTTKKEENVPQQTESPLPIIEVKKPPTPVAAWDNISQIIINKASDTQRSAFIDKNEVESPAVGDTKAIDQSVKSRHSTCLKDNKSLKSSIPRFTKMKPKSINLVAEKNEKRILGSPTNIHKTFSPSRQIKVGQQNQYRKTSSPSRSRASTISSRALSPSSGHFSSSRSKTPSSSATPTYCSINEQQTELQNMLEEMCSTLDQIKDEVDKDEIELLDPSNLLEKEKKERNLLKVNYIMPAKDGAGETYLRSVKNGILDAEAMCLKENSDCDPLSKKTNFLHCLSDLNGQNQLSLKELHSIIKDIIKSNDNAINGAHTKQLELQFYHVEQSQTELVQKLVRTITKFYDEKEQLMAENKKYIETQEKVIPEIENKVGILESENQSLLDKLKLTTQNLEDEKTISQKKKITGQHLATTKSKIQRAEGKLQQIESKINELGILIKKLEALVKHKESLMEQHLKKIKLVETTVNELELENKNLREQIENIKSNEEEKLTNLINDSQELKDAKEQLLFLNEQLDEEIVQREQTSAKLLETTARLKSMEEKCKNLTSLVESAKNEVKLKQVECADKEIKLKEEIDQLRTELQARKVMLKVAEDDVILTRAKLDKAELHYRQEQKKEREISSVEEQLRLDLTLRDEQITQLQEQIKTLIEKKFNNREPPKPKNRIHKLSEKQSVSSFNERVSLTAQVVDLERTIDTLAKDNLQLNQILNQKNLELDQRDRIVKMQTEVLKIRDELIYLLKSKEVKREEDIKRLNNIIQEREHAIAKEWNRAIEENWQSDEVKSWRNSQCSIVPETALNPTEESMYLSGTMFELYSTLEKKQMELEMMQQRVQQLEGMQDAYNQQRTRQEARISKLELALSEKCLDTSGLVPILAQ